VTKDAARRALIVVVALFVTTAGACEQEMDAGTTVTWPDRPTISVPEAGAPSVGGRPWEAAYAIWLCDHFADDLATPTGATLGITTDGDGLIDIAPTDPAVAGANATFGAFAATVGIVFGDRSFTLPSGQTFTAGDDCNGGAGRVWLIEWYDPADPEAHRVRDAGFAEVRLADRASYTLAFVGPGTDPRSLRPPSAAELTG
jgi:hypothetical protein